MMGSNTIWLVLCERGFYSAIDKGNYLGNGAMHTDSHWNYIQGQCLNQSFTGITLAFWPTLLNALSPFTLCHYNLMPQSKVTKHLGFPLQFNECFSRFSWWSYMEVSVEHWLICTNSLPHYKDKSYAFGGRYAIFRHAKWLTVILLEDTRMT